MAPSVYLGFEPVIAYGLSQVGGGCRHFSCTREAVSLFTLKHSNLKTLKIFKNLKTKKRFFNKKDGFPVLFAI